MRTVFSAWAGFFDDPAVYAHAYRQKIIPKWKSQHAGNQPLKETGNSYFCVAPQKTMVNVCLMKSVKNQCQKQKEILCFYNLGEENFLK